MTNPEFQRDPEFSPELSPETHFNENLDQVPTRPEPLLDSSHEQIAGIKQALETHSDTLAATTQNVHTYTPKAETVNVHTLTASGEAEKYLEIVNAELADRQGL